MIYLALCEEEERMGGERSSIITYCLEKYRRLPQREDKKRREKKECIYRRKKKGVFFLSPTEHRLPAEGEKGKRSRPVRKRNRRKREKRSVEGAPRGEKGASLLFYREERANEDSNRDGHARRKKKKKRLGLCTSAAGARKKRGKGGLSTSAPSLSKAR